MPSCLTPVTVFKVWPYGSTRALGQLALFMIGRPKMDFRRLCGSPSAFWTEEWYSCVVKRQCRIGVPVKNRSETLPSAAPRKARRLGSSRGSSQARAWIPNPRYNRISLKMALCSFSTLCPKALALASRAVLVGGVGRPAAVIAPLRACWTLPHSDRRASAKRLPEA